jgi:predicted ferric reductase
LWYTHPFSFSTAKNNEYIRISAKKSGDMTSYLGNLKNGTKVIIDGPLGIFTERGIKRAKMKDKILFIAGGIGITPIRALIEELSQKNKDMVLLYSNKNQSDVPFGPELIEYNCKIHFIFSDEKVSGYEFDRIDEEKIIRLVPDYAEREIFVCGPPQMMDSMISIFEKSGVPKKQVHFEKFF